MRIGRKWFDLSFGSGMREGRRKKGRASERLDRIEVSFSQLGYGVELSDQMDLLLLLWFPCKGSLAGKTQNQQTGIGYVFGFWVVKGKVRSWTAHDEEEGCLHLIESFLYLM